MQGVRLWEGHEGRPRVVAKMNDDNGPGLGERILEAVLVAALSALATGLVAKWLERREKKPKKRGQK